MIDGQPIVFPCIDIEDKPAISPLGGIAGQLTDIMIGIPTLSDSSRHEFNYNTGSFFVAWICNRHDFHWG